MLAPAFAALAALALPAAASAASTSTVFSVISVEGAASIGGKPVKAGAALKSGDELRVEGSVVLENRDHRLLVKAPAVLAVEGSPAAISLASGSVLAIRRSPKARLHVETPSAGIELGLAEFYVEPREGATYVCGCASEGGRRHQALTWSEDKTNPAPSRLGHSDEEIKRLRKAGNPAGAGKRR